MRRKAIAAQGIAWGKSSWILLSSTVQKLTDIQNFDSS